MSLQQWVQNNWQQKNSIFAILKPLSWLFGGVVKLRQTAYKRGWVESLGVDLPVIVVGNISVGGTGKTPVVMWLAQQLKAQGYRPGIISRGFGGSGQIQTVLPTSTAKTVGDEPLMIAQRTGYPMMVGQNRAAVANAMRRFYPMCNVLICDDGLQHYQLKRDVELAVVDATRGLGNGDLLPAGPLREPASRLQTVDAVIINGQFNLETNMDSTRLPLGATPSFGMQMVGEDFVNLTDTQLTVKAEFFAGKNIKAIAGIGNPSRFFAQLTQLGLQFGPIIFDDHHAYTAQELEKLNADVIVMTEKDAVKCQVFARENMWMLPVEAEISSDLTDLDLIDLITAKIGKPISC
jgi:tetraacyldisaccharide 4'-kinase